MAIFNTWFDEQGFLRNPMWSSNAGGIDGVQNLSVNNEISISQLYFFSSGLPFTVQSEETRIWQKKSGHWLCVHFYRSSQASWIPLDHVVRPMLCQISLPYMEVESSWYKTWFAFVLHVNIVIILGQVVFNNYSPNSGDYRGIFAETKSSWIFPDNHRAWGE
jgi:hypothetical protein